MSELSRIQKELKAPKGQYNAFGKYKYRSCEDIVEAIKPILGDCSLILTDDIVLIGDRYYVKATAKLIHEDKTWESTGYARESNEKKGMDSAQVTGAASSYSRKYALNGLFAIDDTKDADSTNEHGKGQNKASENMLINERHVKEIEALIAISKTDRKKFNAYLNKNNVQSISQIPIALYKEVKDNLERKAEELRAQQKEQSPKKPSFTLSEN